MKKRLSYRDKLLELAQIYSVKEVQEYINNKKNLTTGQLELILRKNKIIIPKDFNTSFFKENFTKPLFKVSKKIDDFKEDSSKTVSKLSRKIGYFKEDSSRSIITFFLNLWRSSGKAGLAFLNIIPKLGKTYYNFFTDFFTNIFNAIYNHKVSSVKASKVVIGFFLVIGTITIISSGVITFKKLGNQNNELVVLDDKKIKKDQTDEKKEVKKIKPNVKKDKDIEKPELKAKAKKEVKKREKVSEVILPDLNLKTQTVLNLFDDVEYDLKKVRFEKKVKPIYFTQFPKDLDEIQSVKLKKETFIKIVLPLIVAENEKILDDRFKLNKITKRKITTDDEKQWLRQKFLEYKVKKGSVEELKNRMDMIPVSIALAQAAKESGWGTSRFALEGNAIFGQWTWTGKGIEPLLKDKSKKHKILRFPILRASVKSYKKNLNTHKSYKQFREKRYELRKKNKKIRGLALTKTLDNYAETGQEYTKILEKIINQNRLMDFDFVSLEKSIEKRELNL
ncbi:MAG: hypothetical protein CBE32_000765 [Candidatus Pelagibacter sp. TMED272]|nr:hypothetical protein [Pelagibacteraceae bacterium]RPG93522.1 MAG: hypothetical protein CBE32_000765 [Candidatus Pelagibacter sp. TMED272]|tara:strand:+ start:33516 stop:35036 length:1521 start_codon:yes stop_codon:yes gene_type:complete